MAPLCVCYSCGRHMDCDPSGVCEVCEGSSGQVAVTIPLVMPKIAESNKPKPKMEIVIHSVCIDDDGPDDRQILNILQRLHQNILRENEAYVSYTKACRWQFKDHIYACEHVSIPERDVLKTYKHQMEK